MKLADFQYDLPTELIAQFPARQRSASRLMTLDRATGALSHGHFPELLNHVQPGDAIVVNNTKVFKARLFGRRQTGGQVEIFLVRRRTDGPTDSWEALAKPSRRLNPGEKLGFDGGEQIELHEHLRGGLWLVGFKSRSQGEKIIARYGHVPLPQYIKRPDESSDLRRYQTLFARKDKVGAVAAPTAGFHFTSEVLKKLKERGVKLYEITLHVGPGTFKPIVVDDIAEHTVDPEFAELPKEVADGLNEVRAAGGRVFAVGTTSVRTLESAKIVKGQIQPLTGMVDLYIRPGFKFRVVDHLVTNFHLPGSSLLVLVSAFAGRERILEAYHEAVRERYRFYSYGDAMLIL